LRWTMVLADGLLNTVSPMVLCIAQLYCDPRPK
jgi:hypothetical protein